VGWEIGLATMPPLDAVPVEPEPAVANGANGTYIPATLAAGGISPNPLFPLKYGLAYDTNLNVVPWIVSPPASMGDSQPVESSSTGVSCVTQYCTSNTIMFTVSVDGLTWCFVGNDLVDGVYTNYWIKSKILIERTSDFIKWTPVFTNSIGLNTVELFTDNNAPRDKAFYRVMTP